MERADRRSEERVWEMVCCSVEGKCRSDKDTGNGSEVPMVDCLEKDQYQKRTTGKKMIERKRGFCESSTRTIFTVEWIRTIHGLWPISLQIVYYGRIAWGKLGVYRFVL